MADPKYSAQKQGVDQLIELKANFLFTCNHERLFAIAEQPEMNLSITNPASNGKATSS